MMPGISFAPSCLRCSDSATRLGMFIDQPEKDDGHSEAPDALRQWAQGFDPQSEIHRTQPNTKPKRRKTRRVTGATA